jgi:NADH:ubiquinone oxidoreductase subunit C
MIECAPEALIIVCQILQKHSMFQFKSLTAITGVDYLTRYKRFDLIYILYSIQYNYRIQLKITLPHLNMVNSLHVLFGSACWLERELWDLFGIYFYKNTSLSRLLSDYGFKGFPLRKDFPLSGYLELNYHFRKQLCRYIPIELTQSIKNVYTENISFH